MVCLCESYIINLNGFTVRQMYDMQNEKCENRMVDGFAHKVCTHIIHSQSLNIKQLLTEIVHRKLLFTLLTLSTNGKLFSGFWKIVCTTGLFNSNTLMSQIETSLHFQCMAINILNILETIVMSGRHNTNDSKPN